MYIYIYISPFWCWWFKSFWYLNSVEVLLIPDISNEPIAFFFYNFLTIEGEAPGNNNAATDCINWMNLSLRFF
jgi:hypothetical protein